MSGDEDTQDLPALSSSSAPVDPLHALVDALNEAQRASNQLLDAVRDQALGKIIVTAHDAHSWWLIAKATLRALPSAQATYRQSSMLIVSSTRRVYSIPRSTLSTTGSWSQS